MKSAWKAICALLMLCLALAPAYVIGQTKSTVQVNATAKLAAGTKAKSSARSKAKAKGKAKANAKAKAKATKPLRPASSKPSSRLDPVDEKSLDAEVAAARRILTGKPGDIEAADRLARASVVLIDWVLNAEAVGDTAKARRLTQKLGKDLNDTGWRVQKMARKGDLKARQAAGFLLGRGILLKQDPEKSCAEFLAAAEQLAPAGWHAAQCLMEASPGKAWEQMERAAQRGHAAAQEWMGRRCLGEFDAREKDFACARTYLVQSASTGRSRAQSLLAYLLISGQGGPVDLSRAIRLYKVAAEQGDVNAQNNLGEINETGRGVTRNLDEAMRWYELAAEKGLPSAQFNAGRLWAIGVGDKKDPAKARAFLVQAEGNGIPQARQVLEWLDRQKAPERDDAPALKPATTLGGDAVKN
ncbi:MAG: tetratricopeptide repeat protein [Rhodocyclales bacterium]|nr:tetratricopeptide repeat protein [Rhodocyclales bacterium]